MATATRKVIDQLEATEEVREANGEFLFEGAGEILADLRKARGLTLDEVASQLEIAKTTVMRYEKNEVPLSDYAVTRFAEVYKVDAQALMLQCMNKVLPAMQDSPFGKLLQKMVESLRTKS